MGHWLEHGLFSSILRRLILERIRSVATSRLHCRFLSRFSTFIDTALITNIDRTRSSSVRVPCGIGSLGAFRSFSNEGDKPPFDQDSSIGVSRDGFDFDHDSIDDSQIDESANSIEICEEGFLLDYTTPITTESKFGILDYVRNAKIKRGDRGWPHLLPPVDVEFTFEEIEERATNREATYRSEDQSTFLGATREGIPPWVRPVYLNDTRFVDHDGYISIDGGKLGNKISDLELPLESLRVDTRSSIKEAKFEGEQLPELERLRELDRDLLEFCGVEYDALMLLTVGAQGSGKSKFALDLVEYGSVPWVRINQDTIREGRRGTRLDCVKKAREMMNRGYCVVIDRMNFVPEQRDEFIALSSELRTPIHAIVFRLPFVENVYNVASRRHHEGNFEGTSDVHRQIIYGTRSRLFERGHPRNNNEGFNSVFECRSNDDYAFAFRQWMNYGKKMPIDDLSTNAVNQEPWRIQDTSQLKETAALIEKDGILGKHVPIPTVIIEGSSMEAQQDLSKETIGYLPSRDGPLPGSEDEKGE